ncbi:flagellar basal body P-ring formation chaperone FlgA [Photobacterium aquae]|uniref:flagellar basal body P-ring formation chaperone FlgA n=1 Tax=Photobacterium aquae TaxID=1195763 RepID=UPI00069DA1D6|nr:flagellar basal body P-ring formation chaperone FlgA [Photobacterium aquae]
MRNSYFRTGTPGLAGLYLLLSGIAFPVQGHPLQQQVERYLTKQVSQYARTVGSRDYRIDIKPIDVPAPCGKPISLSMNRAERPLGRVTVTAECHQPKYWKTRVRADVDVFLPLVTLRRNVDREQVLSSKHLILRRTSLKSLRLGYFTAIAKVSGKLSKRKLSAGTVLTPRMIELPTLIRRDDMVTIRAKRDSFTASMKGVALEDGQKGERIRVRNQSSGKTITATVKSANIVETTF